MPFEAVLSVPLWQTQDWETELRKSQQPLEVSKCPFLEPTSPSSKTSGAFELRVCRVPTPHRNKPLKSALPETSSWQEKKYSEVSPWGRMSLSVFERK